MIYCFARADQMVGHRFTDDVAICMAISKQKAIKKFSKLYANVQEKDVFKVSLIELIKGRVEILTDY